MPELCVLVNSLQHGEQATFKIIPGAVFSNILKIKNNNVLTFSPHILGFFLKKSIKLQNFF